MIADDRLSRVAGLLYLAVVVTGIFSLVYVPAMITVPGNAEATLTNIRTHQELFRLGIAAFLVKQVAFLLLPLALYRLLRPVHHGAAVLMAVLATVSVPLALQSIVHKMHALTLAVDAQIPLLDARQVQSGVMQSLQAYGQGITVTSLFWGLWLVPFGFLVYRSGFLPKILGMLLMLGGLGYVVDVLGGILMADYDARGISQFVLLPAAVGEIGICLWLLLVGARGSIAARAGV